MDNFIPWGILKKKLAKAPLTEEEADHFNDWMAFSEEHEQLWLEIQVRWRAGDSSTFDRDVAFELWQSRIAERNKPLQKSKTLVAWWKVAAAVVLITGIFTLFQQISSGDREASLLSKTTVTGHLSKITLADGSVVRLNANSELKYPEHFEYTNNRMVELSGEAYFEVQPDIQKPFQIKVGNVLTTVVGTSFNILGRNKERVEVTVNSGRVKVAEVNGPLSVTLEKGQQVVADLNEERWQVAEVEANEIMGWMKRKLAFKEITFGEALKKMERVYGISVEVKSPKANACLIRATYENEKLETVLQGLQLLIAFDYEIHEDVIEITGYGCK